MRHLRRLEGDRVRHGQRADRAGPLDRQGRFDPILIGKYQRRFPGFDDKIIAMYARGMSTRDIQAHIEEIYGSGVSPALVSAVTDAVLGEVCRVPPNSERSISKT